MFPQSVLIVFALSVVLGTPRSFGSDTMFGIGVHIQDHLDPNKGVVVVAIDKGSPAAKHNILRVGDIINEIDGEQVEDPEFLRLFIQNAGYETGSGTPIELNVETSIGRLYSLPTIRKTSIPVFYHGGTFDYSAFDNPINAILAGVFDGATYKLGPEIFCFIEYAFRAAQNSEIAPGAWLNSCVPITREYWNQLKSANPEYFTLGEMTGGAFFSIRDFMIDKKGDLFGKKGLGSCLNNVTGELVDAAIWLQREGVAEEAIWAARSGASPDEVIQEVKKHGTFAIGAGTLQCVLRGKINK